MERCYTKLPLTTEEKTLLQEQAKERGMRLSKYIRECLFDQRSYKIYFEEEMIEEHTKALNGLREELKKIYRAPLEDKILLSGFFQQMHEKIYCMERDEAKLRQDIRQIKNILKRECMDRREEGEGNANISM